MNRFATLTNAALFEALNAPDFDVTTLTDDELIYLTLGPEMQGQAIDAAWLEVKRRGLVQRQPPSKRR